MDLEYLEARSRLGSLEAMTELGMTLSLSDPVRSRQLLHSAARRGDRVAAIVLRAGSAKSGWGEDGFYLYASSLSAPNLHAAAQLRTEAARCFLTGHQQGIAMCSTNLAYLVRRAELPEGEWPPLDELLRPGLDAGHEFARMNQALRLARGVQCETDWQAADALVASLPGSRGIAEWWQMLALAGDSEGDIVLWWLARHGLTVPRSPDPPEDWNVPVLP